MPSVDPRRANQVGDVVASYFNAYAEELSRAAKSIEPARLERATAILSEAYLRGAHMFSCGNGGSAAIANHM